MRNLGVVALFALLGLVWWSARGRADQAPGEPAAPDSVPEAPAQAAKAPPPPPSPAPAAVPRVRALETLIRTISAASISGAPQPAQRLCEDLRLPDYATWFARRFGAEAGGRLAAEYAPWAERFGTLPDLFRKLHAEGRTELLVERHDDPADPQATGYQSVALGAMKEHATLYSVRLLRPEESSGYSLWSFVYADGGFRFAGKMRDVSPEERSRDAAQLGELRRADAEHFLETGNFPGDD